jgi:phage gpG-like protein
MSDKVPNFKKIGDKLLADVPRYASATALQHFKDSFRKQGWEDASLVPWQGRKAGTDNGRAILTNTAYLQGELRIASATQKAIRIVNDAPYAAIHNSGGIITIRITAKMRKYFWAMYYKTKNEKYKAMALTKKTAFRSRIPQRQFMGNSKVMMAKMDAWFLKQIQTRFKLA